MLFRKSLLSLFNIWVRSRVGKIMITLLVAAILISIFEQVALYLFHSDQGFTVGLSALGVVNIIGSITFVGFVISEIVRLINEFFLDRNDSRIEKQLAESSRNDELTTRISALTQNHPELAEFLEIQRIDQERQDAFHAELQKKANRRSLFVNMVQNFAFFIGGVIVPVFLSKFHLLGL